VPFGNMGGAEGYVEARYTTMAKESEMYEPVDGSCNMYVGQAVEGRPIMSCGCCRYAILNAVGCNFRKF